MEKHTSDSIDAFHKDKKVNLFIVLSGIFLTNALLAMLIGSKIFSLEKTLGFSPANIQLFKGYELSFNLTAGVVIWPVVFVITDVINEYFGKPGVRKITYLSVIFIAYAFLAIYAITELTPSEYWIEMEKKENSPDFNINHAFNEVYLQGLKIIVGSLTAFIIGQLLDATVFQFIRKYTGRSKVWMRATGSTLISQLVDSIVVIFITFYLFGNWNFEYTLSVALINYLYKFVVAILITPLLYVAHYFIDRYLGIKTAKQISGEASTE